MSGELFSMFYCAIDTTGDVNVLNVAAWLSALPPALTTIFTTPYFFSTKGAHSGEEKPLRRRCTEHKFNPSMNVCLPSSITYDLCERKGEK